MARTTDFKQWFFSLTKPLIGLYGRQNPEGIDQLGVISLDTGCQAQADQANVDAAAKAKRDIEATAAAEAAAELARHTAPSAGTLSLVGLGILVFIILLIVARWLSIKQAEKARVFHESGEGDKAPASVPALGQLYSHGAKDMENKAYETKNPQKEE